ncbi:uncharacterized protein LACBIDRAFT_315007 [Laccaria bicolor S238N-H82]|uniref:Uncharacterized protein n=1 Tax=Laccaria bicolor (strain S238N-H82 / ATCC MYA-4686) TaxID=486041 RepID=B0DZJ6_LACBS|nr:uncharacterized protein LACBIDRAFT_315007 [Laccaria bicolor S238N-H82]EDQ99987.1 hypothetical protein LACBIDRAFT_315007 [Laccaria bicolor S238N-H82]|eukprot:XP_001889398.1 hypothetical protein LACBIDRAFT_315007 [Laccaria bicolor S238N-H82]
MRDTIQKLQGELGSSQRVTDLLRDKLHHLSSQLADAQARIKDFEDTERGTLSVLRDRLDDKRSLEVLCIVGTKVEDLTDRLAKHERESIDALAEAAGVEARLIAVTHELQNLKTSSSANLLELQELRVIKSECTHLPFGFTSAYGLLNRGLSKLLASQEVINDKDKEIIGLKAEVKALGESKAELRALVAEAKKAVAEKDRELRDRDSNSLIEQKVVDLTSQVVSAETSLKITREWLALAQSEARERKEESDVLKTKVESLEVARTEWEGLNSKLQAQIQDLSTREALAVRTTQLVQAEIKRVTAEAKKASEEANKLSNRFVKRIVGWRTDWMNKIRLWSQRMTSTTHSRLDEQTAALTLAKDQITANEAGVQEIVHNLRTELAVAHEQKLALERETANLKASFNQLTRESAASLAAAQVDFEKKLNRQEKANERLVSAQEKRAVAAEKAATLAENDAKEARAAREELAGRLALAEMSVIAIAEDGEAAATRESGQMKVMKARAEELEARVGEMTKHAETLLSRYHDANLTDAEKDLVNHVILQTQTSYEQDVVAKDNELRRREHLATGLHSRIHSLEAALAQMLKEKAKSAGPDAKTLLNFRMWLPSSPIDESLQALADNTMEQTIEPVPDAAQRSSPDPAHLSLPAPSPKQQEEMIKPPSPISKPQPRATKQKKKKSFKTLEDADSDYEYDNRDNDLSDLSDLEPLSPAGRCMRKRGRSVSPPATVTVEEPVRTKRRLRATGVQNPAVVTAPAPPSPQEEVSVSTSPAVQKKASDGPAKTRQKKRK